MGKLIFGAEKYDGPSILVVAPHADDETLGCGGLISKSEVPAEVVVFAANGSSRYEELCEAMKMLRVIKWTILYPRFDGRLDTIPMQQMVTDMDEIIEGSSPQEIYYCPAQHHQDHRTVSQVMSAALRPWGMGHSPSLVATYELLGRFDFQTVLGGDMYVSLSRKNMIDKLNAISCYGSQDKVWGPVSRKRVTTLAKLRGAECRAEYAEKFRIITIRR